MNRNKKYIIISIVFFTCILIFLNVKEVRAENKQQEIIEYSKEIDSKMLEDIRTSKLNVLTTPHVKVQANPEQEDITKYYYNQLKSDISRNMYNKMATEISNDIYVDLNNTQYSISENSNTAIISCFETNILPYILDGYEAYITDSARNYWWTTCIVIGNIETIVENNSKVIFKKVEIKSEMQEWQNHESFNAKFSQISNQITGNTTYEIVKSINYYICNNIKYEIIDDTEIEQTVYGAIMLNKAVCEGQSQLFNLLCREKGVTCINVYGYINEGSHEAAHAWNYVYEPTRKMWYAVDVTWNNYYGDTKYIMVGSNTDIDGVQFSKNHIAGFKQFVKQTYTPTTPTLATDIYVDGIALDGNYIKNIQPNTTLEDFKKEFTSDINFYVLEGENQITDKTLIKTGQKFIIENQVLKLVVIGDTNGDGVADIKDIMQINKHRLNKATLGNEYFIAGDTNKDDIIDTKDIMMINKYRLNKIIEM